MFCPAAFAESFMCDKGSVDTGASAMTVQMKCGHPSYKTSKYLDSGKPADVWIYKIKGAKWEFYFENGVLKKVKNMTAT
jgi:hypothetical protein